MDVLIVLLIFLILLFFLVVSNKKSRNKIREYKRYTENSLQISCPICRSRRVSSAGYGDRLECLDCGKVFSR